MSGEASIYDCIAAVVEDGKLPASFELDSFDEVTGEEGGSVRFAAGAMDGISLYHTVRPDVPPAARMHLDRALDAAGAGDFNAADAAFMAVLQEVRAVHLIDELQTAVFERESETDLQALFAYAVRLLLDSKEKELVKVGLSILEIFNEPEEELKDVVRTLGASDEFTLFAVWNALTWENASAEIFSFARNACGWGRIFAVGKLEPETEEIRRWLLVEGCNNDVMPEYSALTCFEKCNLPELLAGDMAPEEFAGAGRIVGALLNEADGPVEGISGVPDAASVLGLYLRQAANRSLSEDDRSCVQAIAAYADVKVAQTENAHAAELRDLRDAAEALLATI